MQTTASAHMAFCINPAYSVFWGINHNTFTAERSNSPLPHHWLPHYTEYHPSEHGSILTEVEKLLHGERRRGEFREMLDVFRHAGQRSVFHDKPDELHCCRGETGLR